MTASHTLTWQDLTDPIAKSMGMGFFDACSPVQREEIETRAKAMVAFDAGRTGVVVELKSNPDLIEGVAKTIWLSEFKRAFSRAPSDPWENQAEPIKEGHRISARAALAFIKGDGQ